MKTLVWLVIVACLIGIASASLPAGVSRMKSASLVCTGLPRPARYTFRMKSVFWLLLFAFALGAVGVIWYSLRKWEARKRANEQRFANFIAGATGAARQTDPATLPAALPAAPAAAPPAAADGLAQQKLLFESARKAGEAGEPALAIQLYARLLARYPATTLASPARAAVEAQKKKLLKEQ